MVAADAPAWPLISVTIFTARATSGVKRGVPVEGRAATGNGGCGGVGGDGRGCLADGEVAGGGCGVDDADGASTGLAGGIRGGG